MYLLRSTLGAAGLDVVERDEEEELEPYRLDDEVVDPERRHCSRSFSLRSLSELEDLLLDERLLDPRLREA